MKLKLDENGNAVLEDGKPVYVKDDGKEVAVDVPGTVATISRLNAEAKSHREAKEAAEGKLKVFEGIEDADAARKALETVKNLDQKKLVDAGEIDSVKAEISKAYETKLAEANTAREAAENALYQEKIGGSFARSKFIGEKLTVPVPMVEKTFGDNFAIEEGKIVATDKNGNRIYSTSRPGELADFDEALEVLVDQFEYKDTILKAKSASGGDIERGGGKGQGVTKGNMGGSREERRAAIAAKFPDLAQG